MLAAYTYPIALVFISLFVAFLEWRFPRRPEQKQLRETLGWDILHLIFNGHFLGVMLFGISTIYILPHLDAWLVQVGLKDVVYRNAASSWPIWVQIIVALVVMDFMQWGIHNLLHRVPFLWRFHQIHHSVKDGEMDWVVAFRFQWTEVVVYKTLQYLPLAYFGFGTEAVMFHAIFGTLIGHLNHANLDWDYGPLRYVLNNPKMHLWHHDYDADEKTTVNFGIVLSCWDWIFGTARVPDHPPRQLGFDGVEEVPRDFFRQEVWPLNTLLPTSKTGQSIAVFGALCLLGLGWWLIQS